MRIQQIEGGVIAGRRFLRGLWRYCVFVNVGAGVEGTEFPGFMDSVLGQPLQILLC